MTNTIDDIENSSTGLAKSIDNIRQSIEEIDTLLAQSFRKAGVVMEYDDFIYQSNIDMKYRLKIAEHDGEWGLYLANILQWTRLSEESLGAMTQALPHILPFLEKYAEVLKGVESEYAPAADMARRIADSIKGERLDLDDHEW